MLVRKFGWLMVAVLSALEALPAAAQIDPGMYSSLRWRTIGPFRGGRTVAAAGVAKQPNVFYIGVNNGGVWKSNDYGRVWTPIFDDQPTGSIGALAIAPSDPSVIYAGSGEGLQRPDLSTGDGVYKSADGGKSWQHLGLRDGQQIPAIAVDPRDANRVFVAVLGHPYGPNEERGIFRSTDGGRTFQKVLYKDENTGGMDIAIDPTNPDNVYAVLWAARQGPWENGDFKGATSGIFKSTDGGTTWQQLTVGLPTAADGLSRVGIEICQANPKRLYAVVFATKLGGVYRSDDAGESWKRMNDDRRLWGRDGDFNEIRSDPKNPDVVYVANVATWKSTDGGKTFASFRGAPGGDDYHRIWINPDNTDIILIASDQGAIITVNGGETWSSWYNQPTAQMFHVNADNAFPYRVCGGQQESGSACVQSRGDDGQITLREWHPVGAEEYGYAVPDPLNSDLIYGGKISRYDRRTGQVSDVTPKPLKGPGYRVIRTAPIVFSPVDPHTLYFASNTLWKTTSGGRSWSEISPDLTRKDWAVPANVGVYTGTPAAKPTQRGVIYAVAPSPLDVNRIWAGTDDGLIHVTTNGGKNWRNVTPRDLVPWAKVSILEASHFDAVTAYAAINTLRLDDLRPHIYRTRDGGTSWTETIAGIADGTIVNVVREDPKRKGLLFAGTEQAVYVSFDDGDHWQPLRLNMPATSIRDLIIHNEDVIVATHGRGFWILDDIEPLRQLDAGTAKSDATLFKPARAWRFRWDKYTDTPMPPDETAGQNPPDGAVIDYYLKDAASGPVTLEILDAAGNLVRRYSSTDKAEPPKDEANIPWYWIRPTQVLPAGAGIHRFVWDLHYPPAPGLKKSFPISAIYKDTAPDPFSPWVLPGQYRVKLIVNGRSYTQPLQVRMDPRVKTPTEGLVRQFRLSKRTCDGLVQSQTALDQLKSLRAQIKPLQDRAGAGEITKSLAAIDHKAAVLMGDAPADEEDDEEEEGPTRGHRETLGTLPASLKTLLGVLQGADLAPTSQAAAAVADRLNALAGVMKRWNALQKDLANLNEKLDKAGMGVIAIRS
ncbi:MAG TPA: glycoside hydrolase [Thermoanaerobaculia bacterium]|nr:glycoside hydrolase [Thermoanaerobaculia bacterium]